MATAADFAILRTVLGKDMMAKIYADFIWPIYIALGQRYTWQSQYEYGLSASDKELETAIAAVTGLIYSINPERKINSPFDYLLKMVDINSITSTKQYYEKQLNNILQLVNKLLNEIKPSKEGH